MDVDASGAAAEPGSAWAGEEAGAALRRRLAALVLDRGYTHAEEPFRLSSGGLSRDYVDLRRAVARGEDLRLAAEAVLAFLAHLRIEFEVIGGMTMGADPVAHAAALLSGRSWFSVRKAEKAHGSRRRIEGAALGPGVATVVFEDTVSTGGSLLDALDVVQAAGAEVVACVTILDRGEEARGRFAGRSVRYEPLLTYTDLGIEPLRAAPGQPQPGSRAASPA